MTAVNQLTKNGTLHTNPNINIFFFLVKYHFLYVCIFKYIYIQYFTNTEISSVASSNANVQDGTTLSVKLSDLKISLQTYSLL